MKVLMIYHSGVGNTKLISSLIYSHLADCEVCDIFSIESVPSGLDYNAYDAYVIGFPTYHARPSEDIMHYFKNIESLKERRPAFIFTTCGWYSANALRIFTKCILTKNIFPVMTRTYKCTATDGVLLAPILKILYDFDKRLPSKILSDSKAYSSI